VLKALIYKGFQQSQSFIRDINTTHSTWYDNISIDPGLNNPLSAHWYAVDFDGNVYVIAEHYMAGKDVKYHADQKYLTNMTIDRD
jgi:predicted NAD-dependent protein-ADP-ribosyltransferase YbiA (DUF1768 family)